jgi:hypothetical protein
MKIDTLKKKLNAEFDFSEVYEELGPAQSFKPGSILLTPHYREHQRPWMNIAYEEWVKGDRTIVLICPVKPTCRYFKKLVTDVAEIRPIKEVLDYSDHRVLKPMIVAIYRKRITGVSSFTVTFN